MKDIRNRFLAALLALALGIAPALANDLGNATWSETDSSNNAASPNGWTSGSMLPSQVEPTARAMAGAIKRFYDHVQPTVTSGGTANVQTLTYSVAPAAYVTGDVYTFIIGSALTNTGATTLNINALGAKNVFWNGAALVGGEMPAGRIIAVAYDGTQFNIIARDVPPSTAPIRSYLAGLTLSRSSATVLGIAVGVATDSNNRVSMALASAYTKSTSAWVVGSGNGGLDTGSIANSTWYHVYLIIRLDTGVVDVLFSTSASAPTMPTNYTLSRRIGSFKTNGSAQIIDFTQTGDRFVLATPSSDYITAGAPTAMTATALASVPTGVTVEAMLQGTYSNAAVGAVMYVQEANTNANSTGPTGLVSVGGTLQSFGRIHVLTNTSAQVNVAASNLTTAINIITMGWIDRRGRDS